MFLFSIDVLDYIKSLNELVTHQNMPVLWGITVQVFSRQSIVLFIGQIITALGKLEDVNMHLALWVIMFWNKLLIRGRSFIKEWLYFILLEQ